MACQKSVLYIAHPRYFDKSLFDHFCFHYQKVEWMQNAADGIHALNSKHFDLIILDIMISLTAEETKVLTDGTDNKSVMGYYLETGFNSGIFIYYRHIKPKNLPNATSKVIIVTERNAESLELFLKREDLTYFQKPLMPEIVIQKAKELLAVNV